MTREEFKACCGPEEPRSHKPLGPIGPRVGTRGRTWAISFDGLLSEGLTFGQYAEAKDSFSRLRGISTAGIEHTPIYGWRPPPPPLPKRP